MVELKCPACGETQIVSDSEVKQGGTIACAACEKPVPLAAPKAAATMMGMPRVPLPKPAGTPPSPRAIPDLPTPKSKAPSPFGGAAAPSPGPDLPTPRRTGDIASVKAPAIGGTDLPTPRRTSEIATARPLPQSGLGGPAPATGPSGTPGLPTPRVAASKAGSTLMAHPDPIVPPQRPTPVPTAAVRPPASTMIGTPDPFSPRATSAGLGPATPGIALDWNDSSEALIPELQDLSMPETADVPTPHSGGVDLPSPRSSVDLPSPHSGGVDLPSPRGGIVDLPTPGGFLSDLPSPKSAPLGADDFFGDGGNMLDLDSLSIGGSANAGLDLDDLQLGNASSRAPAALDLDSLDIAKPDKAASTEIGHAATMGSTKASPGQPSFSPPPASNSDTEMDGLELALPVSAKAPVRSAPQSYPPPSPSAPAASSEFDLLRPAAGGSPLTERIGGSPANAPPDLGHGKTKHEFPEAVKAATRSAGNIIASATPEDGPDNKKRVRMLGGAVLALALAAGGYVGFSKWQTKRQLEATYASGMRESKAAIAAGDDNHWQRAYTSARTAADVKPTAESLGLAAQALLAGYLEDGTKEKERTISATELLDLAKDKGLTGRELDIGQALRLLAKRQPELALEKLAKIRPTDENISLYQGWAYLQTGALKQALVAFEEAAKTPARIAVASYGAGLAHLALGDLAEARTAFKAVIEKQPEHVGAQIGLAGAVDSATAHTREAELLAILERKDLGKADPRAVAFAWVMIGDDARITGRLELARDRYRKAQAAQANDTNVQRALVELELQEGKPDHAATELEKALKASPNDAGLLLAAIELELRRGKTAEAGAKITEWKTKEDSLHSVQHLTKLTVLRSQWLEASGKSDEALANIKDFLAKSPNEFHGIMAAVGLLGRMATKAAEPTQAEAYRTQAKELVAPLEERGSRDPTVGIALGMAFLHGGDPERAEFWFRNVVAVRPTDTEAYFHLSRALRAQKKDAESLSILNKAFNLDPSRQDVGLELANNYDALGRMADAGATFDRLLSGKDVSIDLRGRAGRFYARSGQVDRVAAQADAILALDAEHAAGQFLRGFHMESQGKLEEARRAYTKAVDGDPNAEYFDALARACEGLAKKTGDSNFSDEAIRRYNSARERNPNLRSTLVGLGRLYLDRREAAKALEPVLAANKLNPDDAEVLHLGGMAYQALLQREVAISWLRNAIEKKTNDVADAWHRLAQLYYDINKPDETTVAYANATVAGAVLEKSGTTVPWLTDAYYKLGSLENERGNRGAAKAAWTQYLARSPANATQINEVRRIMKGL